MLGRLFMYRRSTRARSTGRRFASVPENRRVYYFMTRMYLRQSLTKAETSIDKYLGFDLSKRDRARALMQKSLIYYRRKNWDTAESLADQAWKINGKLKRAKKRIASIKRAREREANKPEVKPIVVPEDKRPPRTPEAARPPRRLKQPRPPLPRRRPKRARKSEPERTRRSGPLLGIQSAMVGMLRFMPRLSLMPPPRVSGFASLISRHLLDLP